MHAVPSRLARTATLAVIGATLLAPATRAQDAAATKDVIAAPAAALPDAPSATLVAYDTSTSNPFEAYRTADDKTIVGIPLKPARKYHRVVHPDQAAPPLSAADKFKLSLYSRFSVIEIATTLYSAGISQARDSRPHYGQDAGAFGERFGAIALKHTSQSFFSYGLFATAFHEDPRYYVLGRQHKIVNRAVYSAMRLFITRDDAGNNTANWAKLMGLSSANALTFTYYPTEDRTSGAFAKNELSSVYGTMVNNEIHEFVGDILKAIFHKKQ